MISCPECQNEVSADIPACPQCGYPLQAPPPRKKAGWPMGCLMTGVIVMFLGILLVGIMAGLMLPAVSKALERAKHTSCMVNMKHLEDAKTSWAAIDPTTDPARPNLQVYLRGQPYSSCPGQGVYSYNPIGTPPTCSEHGAFVPRAAP